MPMSSAPAGSRSSGAGSGDGVHGLAGLVERQQVGGSLMDHGVDGRVGDTGYVQHQEHRNRRRAHGNERLQGDALDTLEIEMNLVLADLFGDLDKELAERFGLGRVVDRRGVEQVGYVQGVVNGDGTQAVDQEHWHLPWALENGLKR